MKNDQKVSPIGKPSISISQGWINAEHGETTFLIGDNKVKFDLHQRIPLTDREKKMCMKIESLLPLFIEHARIIFQEDTLERF